MDHGFHSYVEWPEGISRFLASGNVSSSFQHSRPLCWRAMLQCICFGRIIVAQLMGFSETTPNPSVHEVMKLWFPIKIRKRAACWNRPKQSWTTWKWPKNKRNRICLALLPIYDTCMLLSQTYPCAYHGSTYSVNVLFISCQGSWNHSMVLGKLWYFTNLN